MAVLNFKGKSFVQNYHLQVKYHQLIPRKEKSLTDKVSLHDNLIIHGDNLKALKALLPTYAGKIKCIYIDPPYNTGNEKWAYNDNVNSPMMQDWLGKVVDKECLTRHDKWLCMMMPRLKLLRELLTDDGVIFISIDDNEAHRLKMLMETDIFGEDNFLAQLVWDLGTGTAAGNFTRAHEYALSFARSKESITNFRYSGIEALISERAVKKISRGNPASQITFPPGIGFEGKDAEFTGVIGDREKIRIVKGDMIFKQGKLAKPVTLEAGWAMRNQILSWLDGKETFDSKGQKVRRFFFDNKGRLQYEKERGFVNPQSVLRKIASTRKGSAVVEDILGKTAIDFPKPVELIRFLVGLVTSDNDIVLDSFSGSGTTAHAVLALNKEDGGNRRFILVECEDYADKITAERVRRVIKGVHKAKDENLKKGLGGSFSYFELGPPIEMESILSGDDLPPYKDLARYVFYTSTGEEFDEKAVDEKRNFIGESREYLVYLFYKPNIDYLKGTALTLDRAKALGPYKDKRRLVFAPTKYLDQDHLDQLRIDFAQLPFEIYKLVK